MTQDQFTATHPRYQEVAHIMQRLVRDASVQAELRGKPFDEGVHLLYVKACAEVDTKREMANRANMVRAAKRENGIGAGYHRFAL